MVKRGEGSADEPGTGPETPGRPGSDWITSTAMNDSPWQPPSDGERERSDSPAPEPAPLPSPAATDASPWSPEGATTWSDDPPAGAPRVPPPPPPAVAPGATPFAPSSGLPTDGAPQTAAPFGESIVTPDGAPPAAPRKRSKMVVAGAVAAVGALGLAGLFAVQRFSGEAAGGADTADELGLDLLAAIENEDVLGVIDTMLPGERDALGDPFVEMVGELKRLEVLSADTDLSKLIGLDVELADEAVSVVGTNVPDIVNVELAASASVTVDGSTLPIGSFIEAQIPADALTELRGTRVTETDELALELTAVQDGDRWYFSVFHTVAELARADTGGEPIPTVGVAPAGGDSPEAVVDQLLDHVEQLDLRGIISALDPAEAAALQRYAPLFLEEAEAALAEVPLDWRVDVRDFRIEGDGGDRTVFVDALGISGEADGAPFAVSFSDGCVRAEFDGEVVEQCGTTTEEQLDSLLEDAPAVATFVESVEEAFADLEPVGLELRERDGAWYVSPFATVTEAILAAMRALDRDELDRLVEDGTAAADEFFDAVFGGFGFDESFVTGDDLFDELEDDGFEDDGATDDGATDDGFEDDGAAGDGTDDGLDDGFEDDGTDDGFGDDPGDVGTDPEATAWDECYAERAAADAAACFDGYVESGEIDRLSVPASLLYPECGLAELTWEGGLYSATDAEFATAIEAAVPCFAALVTNGEIEEWMVPFEVLYADCFEGRNWYTEFDDDEYNARVDACMDAAD